MNLLEPIDQNIWTVTRSRRTLGLSLGVRMTVIRLPSGGLFLHSPVELTPELREALDELGPVRHVVCPNKMHHVFVQPYVAVYSAATFYLAPGLRAKRPDLAFAQELTGNPEPEWMDVLGQLHVAGVPTLEEIVFFHRPSRSLIVTDLVFNLASPKNFWERLLLTLNGVNGKLACSRAFRAMVRDKSAFRASVERIFVWQPSRVIMSHGAVRELKGIEELRFALSTSF